MKRPQVEKIDWDDGELVEQAGDQGKAVYRIVNKDHLRIRLVEFEPGYEAAQELEKSHVALVLDGEVIVEMADGRRLLFTPSMSYLIEGKLGPHRTFTEMGAKLFIVD